MLRALVFLAACSARGMDLVAPLRDSYVDTGKVRSNSIPLEGLSEPLNFLEAGPADAEQLVVMLHGLAFTAEVYKLVGTLDALAQAQVRAVALDMPGYAKHFGSSEVRQTVLKRFLKAIGCRKKVVIVAASMGGTVGAPYVLSAGEQRVAGYVSVSALLDAELATRSGASDVPTLLVWGALDAPTSSKAKAHERTFAKHQMVIMPDAPHPCYLKDPHAFNKMVVAFVSGRAAPMNESLEVFADWRARPPQNAEL